MSKGTIDLRLLIWVPIACWLASSGRVSWWVVLLIFIGSTEWKISWEGRR